MRQELLAMGLPLVMLLALRTSPVAGQDASQSVRRRVIIAEGWSSFYPQNARVDRSVAHSEWRADVSPSSKVPETAHRFI